jgi:type VI protein secretion system component VasK
VKATVIQKPGSYGRMMLPVTAATTASPNAATVPALLAYALYWWLIRRIGITSLNALLFAVAPTTAVAGAVAFGEAFTWLTAIGFVVSAAAVALVISFDRPRHTLPEPVGAPVDAPVDASIGPPVGAPSAARADAIRER